MEYKLRLNPSKKEDLELINAIEHLKRRNQTSVNKIIKECLKISLMDLLNKNLEEQIREAEASLQLIKTLQKGQIKEQVENKKIANTKMQEEENLSSSFLIEKNTRQEEEQLPGQYKIVNVDMEMEEEQEKVKIRMGQEDENVPHEIEKQERKEKEQKPIPKIPPNMKAFIKNLP